MDSTNEKLVTELNKLIEINNDRIEGYRTAEKETNEPDLKSLFRDMALRSDSFKNVLSAEVKRLGGEPTQSTTTSGKAFRAWMDVKAALTGKDRKAILSSCEFGEDAALATYEDVLKSEDTPLSGSVHEMIFGQKQRIQQDHNRIKLMRDTVAVD